MEWQSDNTYAFLFDRKIQNVISIEMNWFTLKQLWNLLRNYFKNKETGRNLQN